MSNLDHGRRFIQSPTFIDSSLYTINSAHALHRITHATWSSCKPCHSPQYNIHTGTGTFLGSTSFQNGFLSSSHRNSIHHTTNIKRCTIPTSIHNIYNNMEKPTPTSVPSVDVKILSAVKTKTKPKNDFIIDTESTSAQTVTPGPVFLRNLPPDAQLLLLAAIVGLCTGAGVTCFKTAIIKVQELTYGDHVAGVLLPSLGLYNVAVIPVIGGLVVALIRFLNPDLGNGLKGLQDEIDEEKRIIEAADPAHPSPPETKNVLGIDKYVWKSLAAVSTLGTGCSLGPEGPSVEIGAFISRKISTAARKSWDKQKLLLAAGATAGVAAGFNAPIAGVFFSFEVIFAGSFSNDQQGATSNQTIAVLLLSSAISALIAQIGLGSNPAFELPLYDLKNPAFELPLYLGLGLLSGIASILFKDLLRQGQNMFNTGPVSKVPVPVRPILGALFCGLVALKYPQILFFGYETLDALLKDQNFPLPLLVSLLFLKPLATSVSLGSGLVGGTFAPSLFLGATLGATYNKIVQSADIEFTKLLNTTFGDQFASVYTQALVIAGPPPYAMVGMAAVLAGVFRAPLTASLLLFELTRDYRIILPLMAAAGLSSWVAERYTLSSTSTETNAKVEKIESAESGDIALSSRPFDETERILAELNPQDAFIPGVMYFPKDSKFEKVYSEMIKEKKSFCVITEPGNEDLLYGMLTFYDINNLMNQVVDSETLAQLQVGEVCSKKVVFGVETETLKDLYIRLQNEGMNQIPVFKGTDKIWNRNVLGVVDLDSILLASRIALLERKKVSLIGSSQKEMIEMK